jgi:NAD(P)-dependent dehydrogenase (short-subunit alcohol dehydrogenase family)
VKIDLSGRTAVIVGGSGGLGEAMAHTLSGAGAKIPWWAATRPS